MRPDPSPRPLAPSASSVGTDEAHRQPVRQTAGLPRWAVLVGVAACAAVFGLYVRPDFLFTLANQVWACF